jgi:hypothetical protein
MSGQYLPNNNETRYSVILLNFSELNRPYVRRKNLYALQTKAPTHPVVSSGWNCLRPSWPRHTVDSQSTNAGSMLPRALATLSRRASCLTWASTTRDWPSTQGCAPTQNLSFQRKYTFFRVAHSNFMQNGSIVDFIERKQLHLHKLYETVGIAWGIDYMYTGYRT